ncbi:MAG TPA: A24 family peptidase [Oxalicibacterium sp.]|nr:A24 family peptidase [Oxalicibacterium sp.]
MPFLLVLCLAIFVYDVLYRRVPNNLLLLALLIHAGFLMIAGHSFAGIDVWQSAIGGAIAFAVFLPLYLLRMMGAGDVKFFTLLGFLLGIQYLAITWLVASLMAGLHAAAWIAWQHGITADIPALGQMAHKIADSRFYQRMVQQRSGRKGIPYAAYLACAALVATA